MAINKDIIKKQKEAFAKLITLPAPDWLTTDKYQKFLKSRDEEKLKFSLQLSLQTLFPTVNPSEYIYFEGDGAYALRTGPKMLYDKYINEEMISSPDTGQDPKVPTKENMYIASKHAARQWGSYDRVDQYINKADNSINTIPPSAWKESGTFNIVIIDGRLIVMPIDVEHRNWGLVGFPLGVVPLPEGYKDLYYYHPNLPSVYDEKLKREVNRIRVNGKFIQEIVQECKSLGAFNITIDDIRRRFWMNKFNFRFLPFFSREECEDFFGEVNDQSAKSLIQLFHAKPSESLYWHKDHSSIKVTKFKPAAKSLHPVFNNMSESGLVRLESLMISVLVDQYNKNGEKFVDRKDKSLIDNFTESNNDQRTKVSSDLDFLYSLTSKYIDDETGKIGLEITRPLTQQLLYINNKLGSIGYVITDKALFINSFQNWFDDNQETDSGEMSHLVWNWRKGTVKNAEEAYKIIQTEFLMDFDKNKLEKIGVFKEPKYIPRLFDKATVSKSYKENNGNDIDGKAYIAPVGGHIISDMELIRLTDKQRDDIAKSEGIGDTFKHGKNCRAMSHYHNQRMGVLRLSEYKLIMDEPDTVVREAVLNKYNKLKQMEILAK